MTHKLAHVHRTIFLTVFYLLLVTHIATSIRIPRKTWPSNFEDVGKNFQFSTDILDDRSSVTATHAYDTSEDINGVSIKVIGPKSIVNSCFVPFQIISDVGRLPIRRLSQSTVLLSVPGDVHSDRVKLVLVNTQNCSYNYAYTDAVTIRRLIFTNKNSSDERFTLIMNDKEQCHGYDWCRLFFNPFYELFQPLDFKFHSNLPLDIKPATSFDENLFLVQLDDATTNTNRIRLYDFSDDPINPKYKDLITLENYVNRGKISLLNTPLKVRNIFSSGFTPFNYEVKISGLSICWCADNRGSKSIQCSVFREDGSLKFNQTLVYSKSMFPYRVENIPSGFILISRESDCLKDDTCLNVRITVVTRNINDSGSSTSISTLQEKQLVQIKHRYYKLACRDIIAWKTRVNGSDGSIEVEYICLDQSSTSNHVLHVS